MSPSSPIIILDSGLGGLTVARAVRAELPHDEIVYFGDTARLPYGSKSAATVSGFVQQIIAYLLPLDPKHVVIACNTATALAAPAIRAQFPGLSVSGVIDPGARAAASAAGTSPRPVIGVIATEATIRSKAYDRAIIRRRHHAGLIMKAAPLLAPIIEEGRGADDPLVRLALRQYLCPMVEKGLDVLVLGCTHYPILKSLIEEIVGPKVSVSLTQPSSALKMSPRLRALGLMRSAAHVKPTLRCFVTDDAPRFAVLASRFLGMNVDAPTLVETDRLGEAIRLNEVHHGTLARPLKIRRAV